MQLIFDHQTPLRVRLTQSKILLIVKMVTGLMLLACLQVSAKAVGQKVSLNETKSNLEVVLKKIEDQTGYSFLYESRALRLAAPVTLKVNGVTLEQALILCFEGQPLTYKIFDHTVVVKEKPNPFAQNSEIDISAALPPVLVRGKVTDVNGMPLKGVSVMQKGTKLGSTTDAAGMYFVSVPDDVILVFSFVGFITREIAVKNQTTIDVVLEEENEILTKVVVTALGIKREAKSLTYGTQSVGTKELTEARELNVINSLQGKVAGLSVNSSGTGLGSDARVVLRGNRSISGDSQPLYVIDGVVINGNPSTLNSDNIASLTVLKGPNAAALYGSAAQNGVIIIETKKGRPNSVNVSLNNTYMIMKPGLSLPFQNVYGQGQNSIYQPTSESAWGPKMEGQMVNQWSLDPAQSGTQYAYAPQPNNKIDSYNTGSNFSSSLFASVGGKNTQSAFSYTFTKANGILPNNELQRHNISVRVDNTLSKKISMVSKIDYVNQQIDNRLAEGESNFNPNRQIYTMPSNIRLEDARKYEYIDASGKERQNFWNPTTTTGANPFWTLNRNPNTYRLDRVIAMTSLTYSFSEAFKIMGRGSYDGANGTMEEKLYNDTYVRAPDGRYTLSKNSSYLLNGDILASFTKDLNKDIKISGNAGGSVQKKRNNGLSSNTGASMIVPNFFTLSNTNLPVTIDDPGLSSDIQSVYGFANLAWKNAIFLDVTGRNDWSSTLPASSRSYFYPSFGLSAVLTDLIGTFPKFISFAKARASWAEVGSSAIPYMLDRTASFTAGGNYGFLQVSSTLPNPTLLPEKTKSTELGLDVRFLKSRLGLNATLYKTNTFNQLFTIALPVGSGASQYYSNGGNVENKGIELLLSATPIQKPMVNWDVTINFAANRSLVLSISDKRPSVVIGSDPYVREFRIEEGKPYGEIYSKGWKRDSLGRVIVGTDGLPQATPGRTVRIANFNPDWTGGISNSFTYKNLSFTFLIEHRQGGSIVSMTRAILDGAGLTERTLQGREGGLIFGENIFTEETAVLANGSPNTIPVTAEKLWLAVGGRNAPIGEAFVSNATNTRFRELTLGYSVPKKLIKNLPISNLKLSLVGRNLFYIHRASPDLDTDFMQGTTPDSEGFQSFAPPTTRSYGLNLKVDFN
jgi:TonB-linked SusC/RagA family outer membrane protein